MTVIDPVPGRKIMLRPLTRWCLRVLGGVLSAAGVAALVLTAMIATPLVAPPELRSIPAARGTVDMSTLPAIERFRARDGTALGFRHHPASGQIGRVAVVVHGSSGSSGTPIHALSRGLAQHGVESYALDIRGHGSSGTRGDIAYVGQLEDDLGDFVAEIRKSNPAAPLTLIGHSAGGGFALRVAGSSIQNLFARTVLLAPYLGYIAPTNQPNDGAWASADIPRTLALMVVRGVGIECCEALPTLAFAVPPNSAENLVPAYTDRLRFNFGTHWNFRTDLAAATKPVTIYSGADDEVMIARNYAEAVRDFPRVDVRLVEGVNHMGVVSLQKAVTVLADDVATR
jgi:pimeloyl-ACP methyl ester carboxylesterase